MATNAYHFVDRWRVEGDIKEVADILEDALSLPRWWGSTYFDVKEIETGEEHGIGKLISLRAGGWLPYTLKINFRTVESNYPHGFTMDATGDLEGKGIWTFKQDGSFVNVTYDWTIRANKPIIASLKFRPDVPKVCVNWNGNVAGSFALNGYFAVCANVYVPAKLLKNVTNRHDPITSAPAFI